jgi:3-hydroxyisobutyrate dehydrogenase
MAGVHLVASAEAMCLGAKVGLDMTQLFEIISTAAGTSWMFVDRVPKLLMGKWTSEKTVRQVVCELVSCVRTFIFSLFGRMNEFKM